MGKTTDGVKRAFLKLKNAPLYFGGLLIESTGRNPRRKLFQYLAYFIVVILLNFLVGKNIGNTRYPWYSNVSIFLLLNVNIILLVVLLLVIFRNLAKLLSEARSNVFGSRLKFKLVIFSVMLVVIPVAMVFFFASTLINDSINKWFNNQVDSALSSSLSLMEDYRDAVRLELFDQTAVISRIIADMKLYGSGGEKRLENFINGYADKNLVAGAAVYDGRGVEVFSKDNTGVNRIAPVAAKYLDGVLKGNRETGYDFFDDAQLFWAGAPIVSGTSGNAEIYGALFTYRTIPKKIADDIELVQNSRDRYRESEFFSYPVKNSYFILLLTMSLLVVFSGIWGSVLFAGSITKPIEALADASVEISQGNLDVEVREQGGDEISYLIRTFNRMAKLLSVHTKELHIKNKKLSEMYNQISRDNMYIDAIFKNVDSALMLLSHDMTLLKSNARADLLLANNKDGLDGSIKNDLEIFASSEEADFFKNIELVINREKRIFSVNFSKISFGDGERHVLLVIADVTDVVNAQRVSVWKEIAAKIAHEIKNPLTPIKLTAERVKKRCSELKEPEVREIIRESMDTVITEVDNLQELVAEFNLFARLPKAKKIPVEISGLVNEVFSLYIDVYPDVNFSYSGDRGLIIEGDRHQLRRVFQNLINNAVFAMNQSGSVTISACMSGENGVEIKVEDTGGGIKQEDIFKIFDPYFSKRSGGTGLGLAIVKKIIEEHSGVIGVESGPEGTSFVITLPRR